MDHPNRLLRKLTEVAKTDTEAADKATAAVATHVWKKRTDVWSQFDEKWTSISGSDGELTTVDDDKEWVGVITGKESEDPSLSPEWSVEEVSEIDEEDEEPERQSDGNMTLMSVLTEKNADNLTLSSKLVKEQENGYDSEDLETMLDGIIKGELSKIPEKRDETLTKSDDPFARCVNCSKEDYKPPWISDGEDFLCIECEKKKSGHANCTDSICKVCASLCKEARYRYNEKRLRKVYQSPAPITSISPIKVRESLPYSPLKKNVERLDLVDSPHAQASNSRSTIFKRRQQSDAKYSYDVGAIGSPNSNFVQTERQYEELKRSNRSQPWEAVDDDGLAIQLNDRGPPAIQRDMRSRYNNHQESAHLDSQSNQLRYRSPARLDSTMNSNSVLWNDATQILQCLLCNDQMFAEEQDESVPICEVCLEGHEDCADADCDKCRSIALDVSRVLVLPEESMNQTRSSRLERTYRSRNEKVVEQQSSMNASGQVTRKNTVHLERGLRQSGLGGDSHWQGFVDREGFRSPGRFQDQDRPLRLKHVSPLKKRSDDSRRLNISSDEYCQDHDLPDRVYFDKQDSVRQQVEGIRTTTRPKPIPGRSTNQGTVRSRTSALRGYEGYSPSSMPEVCENVKKHLNPVTRSNSFASRKTISADHYVVGNESVSSADDEISVCGGRKDQQMYKTYDVETTPQKSALTPLRKRTARLATPKTSFKPGTPVSPDERRLLQDKPRHDKWREIDEVIRGSFIKKRQQSKELSGSEEEQFPIIKTRSGRTYRKT